MKTNEVVEHDLAEILNNYGHPLFDVAYSMLEDKEFYIVDESYNNDKQHRIEQPD